MRHDARPVQPNFEFLYSHACSTSFGDSVRKRRVAPDAGVLAGVRRGGRSEECQGPIHAYPSRTQHAGGVADQLQVVDSRRAMGPAVNQGTKRAIEALVPALQITARGRFSTRLLSSVSAKPDVSNSYTHPSIGCRRASWNHLERRATAGASF